MCILDIQHFLLSCSFYPKPDKKPESLTASAIVAAASPYSHSFASTSHPPTSTINFTSVAMATSMGVPVAKPTKPSPPEHMHR